MTKKGPTPTDGSTDQPTDPPAAEPERASRRRWSWSWVPAATVIAMSVLALYLGVRFVDRAGDESQPLTNLEQTFFGVYTLLVGAAISWLVTHYYAHKETQE